VVVVESDLDDNTRQPPILVFYSHGNAEDLGGLEVFLRKLSRAIAIPNYCVAYDYCGYGQSTGSPSETVLFQNAEDVLTAMMTELNIPANRVVVWGRSLGSGPTCHLAHWANHKMKKPFAGVVLLSPLLSAFRVGLRSTSYWRLPFDQFCNYERVRNGFGDKTKIFVIHGKEDNVVPFSHGKTINDCIRDTNRYPPLFVEGAGHNDIEYMIWNDKSLRVKFGQKELTAHVAAFIEYCFLEH